MVFSCKFKRISLRHLHLATGHLLLSTFGIDLDGDKPFGGYGLGILPFQTPNLKEKHDFLTVCMEIWWICPYVSVIYIHEMHSNPLSFIWFIWMNGSSFHLHPTSYLEIVSPSESCPLPPPSTTWDDARRRWTLRPTKTAWRFESRDSVTCHVMGFNRWEEVQKRKSTVSTRLCYCSINNSSVFFVPFLEC